MMKSKRWWIVTMQLLVGAALGGVAFTIPVSWWLQGTLCFFWLMAFASATHDIAADGFYMMGLDEHEQAYFVGIRSTFYRIATIFSSGLLVGLAGALQVITRSIRYSWSLVFYLMAGLFIAFWLYHNWILPRPSEDSEKQTKTVSGIWNEFCQTLITFFQKPQVLAGICFMLFYRMPEGLLAKVSALFLVDAPHNGGLGLSDGEYGLVQGTVGVIGLTIGGILGGFCASRDGLKRWLWPMVLAITLPDIVYVLLAYLLPSSLVTISVCVFIEQFGYGFGFSAYMLYLIYYSQGEHKTAHYALCTAFMALSMMIPGLFAGALQESVGYQAFFLIVVGCCAMTYIVSALLKIDPEFGKKKASE
jgi:PAT family beta-lactamase induction signal transducer AmpG